MLQLLVPVALAEQSRLVVVQIGEEVLNEALVVHSAEAEVEGSAVLDEEVEAANVMNVNLDASVCDVVETMMSVG